jgi:hypothetical protein
VLLRLTYLAVTNTVAMLRLLPIGDRAKDVEILARRHQITVLERQLHGARLRLAPADQALLAALLHGLPRNVLHQIRLLLGVTSFEDAGPGYVIPGEDDLDCLSGVGLRWVAASW